MATVPGPKPDKPLPIPGAPAEEPQYEPEEEPGPVGPERGDEPEWLPKPYDPEREYEEPGVPISGSGTDHRESKQGAVGRAAR